MLHCYPEGGLRHSQSEGADAGAEQVQGLHGDLEALVNLTENVVIRHINTIEHPTTQRMR
jgi:hypothetical protein